MAVYTIGCHTLNKKGEPSEGIYAFDKYGLAWYTYDIEKLTSEDNYIYYISNSEDAKKYVQRLTRRYRFEFKERARRLGTNLSEFRFYLIRISEKQFPNCEFIETNKFNLKKDIGFTGNWNNIKIRKIQKKS